MDENKLQNDVRRGLEAQGRLDSLSADLEYVERSIVDSWKATGDAGLWNELKALERLRGYLQSVIQDGRLADTQIQQLIHRRKQKRYA